MFIFQIMTIRRKSDWLETKEKCHVEEEKKQKIQKQLNIFDRKVIKWRKGGLCSLLHKKLHTLERESLIEFFFSKKKMKEK